ncbi:MAG: Uncharacterised protein [Hyphomonas sp. TMED17]|nr:MAG: Uncharacterised protein [Hyphomonas sp. TMED17]
MDLLRRIIELIVAFEFLANGFFQFGKAVGWRVFCMSGLYCCNRRGLNMLGCVKVRLARSKSDDIFAGAAQLRSLCRYRNCGRRFDPVQGVTKDDGLAHGCLQK